MIKIQILGGFCGDASPIKVVFGGYPRPGYPDGYLHTLTFHNRGFSYQNLVCLEYFLREDRCVQFGISDFAPGSNFAEGVINESFHVFKVITLQPRSLCKIIPLIRARVQYYAERLSWEEVKQIMYNGTFLETLFEDIQNAFGETPQLNTSEEQLGQLLEAIIRDDRYLKENVREAILNKMRV